MPLPRLCTTVLELDSRVNEEGCDAERESWKYKEGPSRVCWRPSSSASSPNALRCELRAQTHPPSAFRMMKPPDGERRTPNMCRCTHAKYKPFSTQRSWQRTRHKIKLPEIWETVPFVLLLLLLSVSSVSQAQSFSNPVDCTYANSTCTDCVHVCTASQLYNLFPSSCDPTSMVSHNLNSVGPVSTLNSSVLSILNEMCVLSTYHPGNLPLQANYENWLYSLPIGVFNHLILCVFIKMLSLPNVWYTSLIHSMTSYTCIYQLECLCRISQVQSTVGRDQWHCCLPGHGLLPQKYCIPWVQFRVND